MNRIGSGPGVRNGTFATMAESLPTYKFILLGDLGVGKTTFFLQLKHGRYIDSDTDQFTGSDHLEYTQVVDGTKVKVSRKV